jgi:hypothetical protein
VAVRCRPMNGKERGAEFKEIVQVDQSLNQMSVFNPKDPPGSKPKLYTFDYAYGSQSTQKQVYEQCASQIITSVLEGYNGTIFAYGQTGTGKTHTMEGERNSNTNKGIIPRAFEHVFKIIKGTTDKRWMVQASMLELYNEDIGDLLTKSEEKLKLKMNQDGSVYVDGLSYLAVKDENDCMKLLDTGSKNKEVASTDMNERSSRSHCIFSLVVESSEVGVDGEEHIKKGKLNLVDLAGSERQKKTKSTGQQFKEACSINLSLVTLGNVIQALVEKTSTHVPYRDSKLTRLLQDSLGGNAKTLMLAAVGPADYNHDETTNTLRYANRAKNIKNIPKINENPKDAKIREMQDEIEMLKKKIAEGLKGMKGFNLESLMAKGGDGHSDQLKLLEQQIREEEEILEKQAEEERRNISEMQNIDKKKREELMLKLRKQQEKEEAERKEKERILQELKDKEENLLVGKKQNEEEMKKYSEELERMRKEVEEKNRRQNEMQKEIANTYMIAEELNNKLLSNKGNMQLKAQTSGKLSKLLEQQRAKLEALEDDQEAAIRELREELKDKQKMYKLNQVLMRFIPSNYKEYLKKSMDKTLNFPFKSMTGNKILEERLQGDFHLLNAWKEGNDPVIVYHTQDEAEEEFYRSNRHGDSAEYMYEDIVPIIGKLVPTQAADDGDN